MDQQDWDIHIVNLFERGFSLSLFGSLISDWASFCSHYGSAGAQTFTALKQWVRNMGSIWYFLLQGRHFCVLFGVRSHWIVTVLGGTLLPLVFDETMPVTH